MAVQQLPATPATTSARISPAKRANPSSSSVDTRYRARSVSTRSPSGPFSQASRRGQLAGAFGLTEQHAKEDHVRYEALDGAATAPSAQSIPERLITRWTEPLARQSVTPPDPAERPPLHVGLDPEASATRPDQQRGAAQTWSAGCATLPEIYGDV